MAKKKSEEEIDLKDLTAQDKENQQELERLRRVVAGFANKHRPYIIEDRRYNNTLRFAIISDPHIGSLYERVDAWHAFYKILKSEKITTILSAGDTLEGWRVYRGQEFEMYAHGHEDQLKALKKRVPEFSGKTFFITGNHDTSYKKLAGCNIGENIADSVDWNYLGEEYAEIILETKIGRKWKISLLHPSGGTPYAISYRTQKIIESFSGGQKPNLVVIGHLHKAEMLPAYRNVVGVMAGCFQSQTPFMARKPTPAHVGGWIFEVTIGSSRGLTNRVKSEFIPFYEPTK